jgi:polar amino acid transport system permease protein
MENLTVVIRAFPFLLRGTATTLALVLGALAIGFSLGVPMAVLQMYGRRWIAGLIAAYAWFFRGLPVLVLFYLFYFALFTAIGLNLPALASAILVLGMRSAAYQSQLFLGSLRAIRSGQMMAALSVGMTRSSAIRHIILPQALRLSIAGWSNEYSIILKDSAIAYAIGVTEILTRAHFISTTTFRPMPVYLTAGAIFLGLTYGGLALLNMVERRVKIPGFGPAQEESR